MQTPQPRKLDKRLITRRAALGGMAAGLVGAFGYARFIEPTWLEIREITIPIRDLAPSFDGYKVGLVSDIHWPINLSEERMRGLGEEFARREVDVLCIPGDLMDGHDPANLPCFRDVFEGWGAKDGIYATLGNHDHAIGRAHVVREVNRHTPLELIDNARVLIERGSDALVVAGVGDLWEDRVDAQAALGRLPDDLPRILLSHNPDVAEELVGDYRVDLQLSGHTHGGMLGIGNWYPGTPSRYGNKFREGLCQGAHHRVFVSKGISPMRRHLRFGARPDIAIITLRAPQESV